MFSLRGSNHWDLCRKTSSSSLPRDSSPVTPSSSLSCDKVDGKNLLLLNSPRLLHTSSVLPASPFLFSTYHTFFRNPNLYSAARTKKHKRPTCTIVIRST